MTDVSLLEVLTGGTFGPLIIFCMRILDVSMGTVRMLSAVQGRRLIAALIGVVEVTIWVLAAGTAIKNLDSFWHLLGYSGGFAAGTAIGVWIEEKIAFGYVSLRIISAKGGAHIAHALREAGFGATEFPAVGGAGKVAFVISVVRRRRVREALRVINEICPEAFVTMEMPRSIQRGYLGQQKRV